MNYSKTFKPAKIVAMIIESDRLYTELSELEDREIAKYYGMMSDFKGSKELQKLKKEHNKLTGRIYLIAQATEQHIWDQMVKDFNLCGDGWSWIGFEF